MSKALLGLAALAALGGLALYNTKNANASPGSDEGDLVQGASGTTYLVKLVGTGQSPDGRETLTFDVEDAAGLILRYTQFRGDNSSRILIQTPQAPHLPGSQMWNQAVSDFGVFTSI